MCKQYLSVVGFALAICFSYCGPPSYLTRCKAEDTKCITDAANVVIPFFANGLPDYKVEVIDPIFVKSINASDGSLLFVVTDATIVGLKNCKANQIQRDKFNSKLNLNILCNATLDGQYILKGSLLVFPIEGKGRIHVDLNSCEIQVSFNMISENGADGKSHWKIMTWSHSFDLKAKSNVIFEGLYEGNEFLSQAARELVANHGNEIIKEIGPKVIKAIVRRVIKNINNFFKDIPSEDLALD